MTGDGEEGMFLRCEGSVRKLAWKMRESGSSLQDREEECFTLWKGDSFDI